jgi:hypothetical protein
MCTRHPHRVPILGPVLAWVRATADPSRPWATCAATAEVGLGAYGLACGCAMRVAAIVRAVDAPTRSVLLLTPVPLATLVAARVNVLVRGVGPEVPPALLVRADPMSQCIQRVVLLCGAAQWDEAADAAEEDGPYWTRAPAEGMGAAAFRPRHNLQRRRT